MTLIGLVVPLQFGPPRVSGFTSVSTGTLYPALGLPTRLVCVLNGMDSLRLGRELGLRSLQIHPDLPIVGMPDLSPGH